MFDSKVLYALQALLIAGCALVFIRHEARLLKLQLLSWTVGTIAVMWRFGPTEQLGFYSNDQFQYSAIVRTIVTWTWPPNESPGFSWWAEFSKLPYTAAAVPFALVGIHIALALKTVSLICLLLLSRDLLKAFGTTSLKSQTQTLYFTGCGLIGTFFSMLALRETMMMLFVFRYVTTKSTNGKLAAITFIFLLRSHLAAALVVAEIILIFWRWLVSRFRLGFAEVPLLILIGVTLGYIMFSWRLNGAQDSNFVARFDTPFTGNFGITETVKTASNFSGLQFLTAHEAFIRLSIGDLLLLRLLFSDTVIIPCVFTVMFLIFGNRVGYRDRFTILAFSIYVSIVTNTDFNSFRQNIPFMPLMGVTIFCLGRRSIPPQVSSEFVGATSQESARLTS